MTEIVFNVWEMQGKHWQPNDRLTTAEFSNIIVVSVYALKPETCSDWSSVLSLSDSVATS